jgi:signal transduction histidine kinase
MEQGAVDLAQVISSIAHDLRSPLNTIIGFARLLLNGIDGPMSEMQGADVQAIHTSGDEMLRMVDCLIDLARIQTGDLTPSPSAVHLDALLEKVVALHTGVAAQAESQITYAAVDLPQPLWLDGALLQKALERLLVAVMRIVGMGKIEVDAEMGAGSAMVRLEGTGSSALSPQAVRALQAYQAMGEPADYRLDAAALHLITARHLLVLQGAQMAVETPSPARVCVRLSLPRSGSRTGPKLDP